MVIVAAAALAVSIDFHIVAVAVPPLRRFQPLPTPAGATQSADTDGATSKGPGPMTEGSPPPACSFHSLARTSPVLPSPHCETLLSAKPVMSL